MKKLRIKMLSLGIVSSIIISSTPVFAANNTNVNSKSNKEVTTASSSNVKKPSSNSNVKKPSSNSNVKKPSSNSNVKKPSSDITVKATFDYSAADSVINDGGVIEYGDQGREVSDVQDALMALGYLNVSDVDGYFGSRTRNAVKSFQRSESRYVGSADGKVGRKTWRQLKFLVSQD